MISFQHTQITPVVVYVTTAIDIGIYLPLLIYYGIQYYKYRSQPVLKKRYASITIIELIIICIGIVTGSIMNIFILKDSLSAWTRSIRLCIAAIAIIMTVSCWILRFWMLYFGMKWHLAIMNQKWICIINANATNSNWFILNKNTFGNVKWCAYRMLLWIIFGSIITIAEQIIFNAHTNYLPDSVVFVLYALWFVFYGGLPLIVLFVIYFHLPLFQDNFYISKELKLIVRVFLIGGFLAAIAVLCSIFLAVFKVNNPMHDMESLLMAGIFSADTSATIIMMISTYWVLTNVNTIIDKGNKNKKKSVSKNVNTDHLLSISLQDMNCVESNELKHIFNCKELFEIYIDFMSKDLCMELILAFIEIIQLQQWIVTNNIEFDAKRFKDSLFESVIFYEEMIDSSIVYHEGNNDDNMLKIIKIKSNKLFYKYIEYGSQYEIILKNTTREQIIDIMSHLDWIDDDTVNVNHIINAFDQCCTDIFATLIAAFGRFQATNEYKHLVLDRL
eukprot:79483_1